MQIYAIYLNYAFSIQFNTSIKSGSIYEAAIATPGISITILLLLLPLTLRRVPSIPSNIPPITHTFVPFLSSISSELK